jgi:DNA-binding MarR family transcriptional regulator
MSGTVKSLTGKSRAAALSALSLAVFRSHGALLAGGDRLVEPLGLTSARWQVLGALMIAGCPLTVPGIAAAMGLTRQGVQKQVDRLEADGHVAVQPNPEHRRSPRIELTRAGRAAFVAADRRWGQLAARLSSRFSLPELEVARRVLDGLSLALEHEAGCADAKEA